MADLVTFRGTVLLTDSPDDDTTALDAPDAFTPAEVAGKDRNVPRRPGQILRPRYPKRRIIPFRGHVKGLGASGSARWTSFRTASDALFAVMDRSLGPGQLVLHDPYLGLAADKTLDARCVRVMPGETFGGDNPMQRLGFELECVDEPPEWVAYTPITLATSAAADDILDTTAAHGLAVGDRVVFTSLTGGSGLTAGTPYYVIAGNLAAQTFQVSTTAGGSAVNFTTDITAGTVAVYERAI